jgi:NADPH2:quinone reductase
VYTERGPAAEVLRVVDVPDPVPGPGEVRVRLRASGVNPTDWKSRQGGGAPPAGWQIPNQDGAGEVDAVGEGVDPGRVGQRVWVHLAAAGRPNGTAATYTCVPAEAARPLPDGVSYGEGAGLGIPFVTAHRCLFADGPISGRRVLVTGGAGAVGHAAVQLARLAGARVLTTVSSSDKAAVAATAGPHAIVNYRAPDFLERLQAAAGDGVDRVVDVALGANLEASLAVLRPHGVIVSYASENPDPVLPTRRLMTGNVTIRYVLVYGLTPAMLDAAVVAIGDALAAGELRGLPERHFALEDIAQAHDAVEAGAVGKVIVDIP